jgi:hypothetical protein
MPVSIFKRQRVGGDGEVGRWGDGEVGRWGDGEVGRWGSVKFESLKFRSSTRNL